MRRNITGVAIEAYNAAARLKLLKPRSKSLYLPFSVGSVKQILGTYVERVGLSRWNMSNFNSKLMHLRILYALLVCNEIQSARSRLLSVDIYHLKCAIGA